jgi:drug/metabolite transporter (DMT)-like permease
VPGGPKRIDPRGYVIVIAVAIFWAAATLWLAGGRGDLGSIAASTIRTPAGAVGMLSFAMATSPRDLAVPFRSARHIGSIAAIGVASTLLGSLLYVYAVGEAGAARTTILNAASPMMALPLSIIFLKEPFTRTIALGTAVCVAGILLVVV